VSTTAVWIRVTSITEPDISDAGSMIPVIRREQGVELAHDTRGLEAYDKIESKGRNKIKPMLNLYDALSTSILVPS
jgi:hypothetical protein